MKRRRRARYVLVGIDQPEPNQGRQALTSVTAETTNDEPARADPT